MPFLPPNQQRQSTEGIQSNEGIDPPSTHKQLLGMSVLCEYATAAYFTYCANMRLPHILHIVAFFAAKCTYHIFFPHKLAFLTAILTFFVFLFKSRILHQQQHW